MRYLFEGYALDIDRRELHRGTEAVSIAPQEFDLLDYLIRNRDRVVSKDDIIQAIWKGRAISDTALTTRLNAVRTAIGDSGETQRLIKTLPRRGFRFIGQLREETESPSQEATGGPHDALQPLALPDKPSIAILPFNNLSSDPEQDYFTDGIVDDIITALSRFKSVFVIARNSSFTYKGRAVDLKQVGRELGVRYVLEGSVRKASDRVRITCQLIDATTGMHLWADRYEGDLGDVFALQDEITVNVIAAIAPKLLQVEIDLATRRRPNDLSAHDHYLRAHPHYYTMTRDGVAEAVRLLNRALEIDPRYSAAASLGILCHTLNLLLGWSVNPQFDASEATRLSQLVLSIDENDPETLACVGWAKAFISHDAAAAVEIVDRAVALNPNSAIAWSYRGFVYIYAGIADEALRSYEHTLRLSPLDPMRSSLITMVGISYLGLGRFEEALDAARKSIGNNPSFLPAYLCLASAFGHLGRREEADQAVQKILQMQPGFRASSRKGHWPALYVEGLLKAGLPD